MPDSKISAFGLCGPTYATRNRLFNSESVKNWYPSVDESGNAQSKIELAPSPGIVTWSATEFPPVRGLYVGDNRLFAVGDTRLHEISSSGAITATGLVNSGGTPIQFAASDFEILLAGGDAIWR